MIICEYSEKNYKELLELLEPEVKNPRTEEAYNLELFDENYGTFYKKFIALDQDNGDIIGVIVVSFRLDTAEINYLFVNKKERKQGIGTLLVNYVERYIKDEKYAEGLIVNTEEKNIGAQGFYKKMGFKETGKVFNLFSNNSNQIFYWKKL